MAFEDVDDFEDVREVAEEDDVAFVGEAAQVGAEFRARAAKGAGKGGELGAFATEFFGEANPDRPVSAPFGNIPGDAYEVGKCRIEKNKTAQLVPVLRQFRIEGI